MPTYVPGQEKYIHTSHHSQFSLLYLYKCHIYDTRQRTCAAWPSLNTNAHTRPRKSPLALQKMAVCQSARKCTCSKASWTESGTHALSLQDSSENTSRVLTYGFDTLVPNIRVRYAGAVVLFAFGFGQPPPFHAFPHARPILLLLALRQIQSQACFPTPLLLA